MSEFIMDPRLGSSSEIVHELPLSRLFLSNNSFFPWVILVPRRNDIREIIDLSEEDRIQLLSEISLVSKVMQELFKPHKLNVAALGNVVPQLHVHVIARYENDAAWPGPTFGSHSKKYDESTRLEIVEKLRQRLSSK